MKKRKYRKLLKKIRDKVFRVTVQAVDDKEPHLEEMSVVTYNDIIEILGNDLRRKK